MDDIDFPEGDPAPTEELVLVDTLPSGFGIWKRKEGHGGYSFWTDSVGLALRVWDEALDDPEVTLAVWSNLYSVENLGKLRDDLNLMIEKKIDRLLAEAKLDANSVAPPS